MSRARAISPMGTGASEPLRASSARARTAYGDFVVITSTLGALYGMHVALLRRLDPWLPPLVLMAVIFALSAQPNLNSGLGLADTILRKLVHFGEFALLAFLWWRVFVGRLSRGRAAVAAFVVASLYALSDELHQHFVSGRHGSPVDWAIDSAGAGLSALRLGSGRRVRARN
jgi:hypothetical protein